MGIKKIKTETLRQKVYNQLRTKILGAEILPGEVISLRGLAEKFGVSLLPVREAVWQLESEKILVIESNKRIQVNHLTRNEFKEILNLRLLLETEAVDKACQLRTKKAVTKVKKILDAMGKYVGVNDKEYIKKNDQFHYEIYSSAGSPILMGLIQRLLARVNPYIYMYAIDNKDLSGAVGCHLEMYEGFADGDSPRAVTALRKDLQNAGKIIIDNLED